MTAKMEWPCEACGEREANRMWNPDNLGGHETLVCSPCYDALLAGENVFKRTSALGREATNGTGVRYRTIVVDPPWPYPDGFADGGQNHLVRGERKPREGKPTRFALPYPSMTVAEILSLPVDRLADPDCRLFLWSTSRYLVQATEVLDSWGFTYKQLLVWDKRPNVNPLSGSVAATSAEFLLVGVRGKPARLTVWPESIISSRKARSQHSRKPDVFLDLVETVSPGPYLEMFARRNRLGWDTWGNEALEHVEIPA